MNAKQVRKAQTLTSTKWLSWKSKGLVSDGMAFSADDFEDSVILFGSNLESKESYERLVFVTIILGPKGGIHKFSVKTF
jgi:hypothetical protein